MREAVRERIGLSEEPARARRRACGSAEHGLGGNAEMGEDLVDDVLAQSPARRGCGARRRDTRAEFHRSVQPSVKRAKGHAYYLYHSPEDETCELEYAEAAVKHLGKAGAKITMAHYEGGHGWHGDTYGNIRKGVRWLEQNATPVKPSKKRKR